MLNALRLLLVSAFVPALAMWAQNPPGAPPQASERITGTVTAVDQTAHKVSVKEDKTGTVYGVELQNTKSLRKVDPATLDLKKATRITVDDLMVGDRVQVFASKAEDDANALAAKALILISARDLQNVHQEQTVEWQHSTGGVITEIDARDGKISMLAHTPQGPKPLTVDTAKAQFTRYSPENPKISVPSQLRDIQVGDQVRVIGESTPDGSTLTARKVYSSAMRTIVCTVSAISSDAKSVTVKDLQSKQPVIVTLNNDSAVRKLPPMMAMALARRLNPAAAGANGNASAGNGNSGAGSQAGAKQGEAAFAPNGGATGANASSHDNGTPGATGGATGGFRAGSGMRNGDLSQLLERLPKISVTDLKPGDALMIAGTPIDNDKSHLLAANVIAGVEPIFQAASPRQMGSLGDWGLSAGDGAMDGASPQ